MGINRNCLQYLVPGFLLLLNQGCSQSPVIIPETRLINDNWVFNKESDSSPYSVSIPHIPRIEPLVVNDQWQGEMTYVRHITIDNPYSGKSIIHFEGVMHSASVYVNGTKAKEHSGGYLPFSVDITKLIGAETNEIRVEVTNKDDTTVPPGKLLEHLDFNFYGGIYRDVRLIRKNDVYITDPFLEDSSNAGFLVHFDQVSKKRAEGSIRLHIRNDSNRPYDLTIEGSWSQEFRFLQPGLRLGSKSDTLVHIGLNVDDPQLWSTSSPYLYDLKVQIRSGKLLLDEIGEKIGIRKIELKQDGFYLNNEKQFIKGTNRHQEYPYVGYALSNNANYRDAVKIKNAGFDFVRLSHYPQDEAFLDACDELGILVMNAIPGWQYFEEGAFVENSFQDIRDMVRRDRNHPSVIFWEVSLNESGMSEEYMIEANRILKEELPFDDTYSAGWMDHPSYDLFIPARQHGKPPTYWNEYKQGERSIFIAEYGDWEYYAHNAGFNQKAFKDLTEEERNSRQLRGYGEKRLLQQALNFQEAANSNRTGIGTIGHANWVMFDYNRGYANDLEASGISDIFRIPKFSYYFYKSQRPPQAVPESIQDFYQPFVEIASHWNTKSATEITIYSNCDEVELLLNDKSVGRNKALPDRYSDHLRQPPFKFDLGSFTPGKLEAVGFIDGIKKTSDVVNTSSTPNSVVIDYDLSGIPISTTEMDIIFIYARIVDKQGYFVCDAEDEIQFHIEGEAELIGENPVNAEAGIASILLRTFPGFDRITIRAGNDFIESDKAVISGSD